MKKHVKYSLGMKAILFGALLMPLFTMAQYPTIKLSFEMVDTVKFCKAVVMNSATEPATEVSVNFFVKRFYGLLPIGASTSTDENGVAKVNFPVTVPLDEQGKVEVIARLEDDETVISEGAAPWGIQRKVEDMSKQNEIWAPRSNVALSLIVASNLIILVIWGVMAYVVYLVYFRIPKVGQMESS